MMRRWILGLMLGLVVSPATEARPTPPASPLSLGDVLASTVRAYGPILAAAAEREAAEAELRAVGGAFDTMARARVLASPLGYYQNRHVDTVVEQPTTLWGATVYGGYRWGSGNFAPYYGQFETADQGEYRAGLRVPLLRNGPIDRRRADLMRQALNVDIAGLRLEQQRLEALRLAAQRYWDWVAAGQRLQLTRGLVQTARERQAALEATIRMGETAAIEGTENARAIQQRQAQLVAAERALQQAALELSLFLRRSEGALTIPSVEQVPASFPPVVAPPASDLAESIRRAQLRRPEVLRLLAQREQSEIEVQWARNQHLPGIDLQTELSQDVGAAPASISQTNASMGLMFELPIQRRVASGRQQAAEASIASLEAQAQFTTERVGTEVRDAFSALEAASQSVGIAREELKLARQLVSAEQERFRLGATTLLIVNLREQAAFEAGLREVDAMAAFQRAMANLQAATTALLEVAAATGVPPKP